MGTRKQMYEAIKADYPLLLDDFINLVLDMYESDPDYIENLCKEEKKKAKGRVPKPKTQLTLAEFEALHQPPPTMDETTQEAEVSV